jgi:hypothetical protein
MGMKALLKCCSSRGVDVDAEDFDGDTVVIFADRRGHSSVLNMLQAFERRMM